jgi:hypothetical protein
MTKFDLAWGSVLGFEASEELADIVVGFVKGFTAGYENEH